MPKLKVSLSIGYPTAKHEDVINVDDEEYNACETDNDREELLESYWRDWSNNYIEGYFEIVD